MVLLIASMVFAIVVAIFAIQNSYSVSISFFWLKTQIPLVLVILGSAFAGALIVFLIALWREFNLRKQNKAKFREMMQQVNRTQETQKDFELRNKKENINTQTLENENIPQSGA